MGYKKPKVSVIIPCFNHGRYIDDAVESVLNQTFEDHEITIVNDGSTDEFTINKLKNYKKSKCKVIHTINQGPSIARNIAIKASSGEYILPLDADDKIGAKYLEEAVKILEKESKIGIVYCDVELFGVTTGKWNLPDFSIDKILVMNMIICSALFRKSDYLETKGYNPNMIYGWEDWDFWLSLIENGKGVYKLPGTHFFYRINKENTREISLHLSPEKQKYCLKTIYHNHYDFYINKMGNPIEIYSKLNNVLSSKDYKIGRIILNPLRKVNNILKKTS
jgi:glycosyltransferase involved in cell wall biosynthesis